MLIRDRFTQIVLGWCGGMFLFGAISVPLAQEFSNDLYVFLTVA
jgi:hypothetical protein